MCQLGLTKLVRWFGVVPFLTPHFGHLRSVILWLGGSSHLEMFVLYEAQTGETVVVEQAVPRSRGNMRTISVSAVPFGSRCS